MADQYIDQTYVEATGFGSSLVTAIAAVAGTSLTTQIEAATSEVQTAMRNSGYAVQTMDPYVAADVEEYVKLATLGSLWKLAVSIPAISLALPEDWDDHPAAIARAAILTGTAKLAADPDTRAGVGGSAFTSSAATASPQQFSRAQLEGY